MLFKLFHRLLIAAVLTSLALCTLAPGPETVLYWGQSSGLSLQDLCTSGIASIVVLSFVNKFGYRSLNLQMDSVNCSSPGVAGQGQSGCADIAAAITTCQQNNVKVMLSMGGALESECTHCKGDYLFQSVAEAQATADQIWQAIFNLGLPTAGVWRPFGSSVPDGIDLDIEGKAAQPYFESFVSRLLSYDPRILVSGAPVCYLGCSSGNCQAFEASIPLIPWTYLFIQFYNDRRCSLSGSNFAAAIAAWDSYAPANTTLLVGVPGDTSRRSAIGDGEFFVPAATVVSTAGALRAQYPNRNVGVGIWDAYSAQTNSFGSQVYAGLAALRTATQTYQLTIQVLTANTPLRSSGDNLIAAFVPFAYGDATLPLDWRLLGNQSLGTVKAGQTLTTQLAVRFTKPVGASAAWGFAFFTRAAGPAGNFGPALEQFAAQAIDANPGIAGDQPPFNSVLETWYNYTKCEGPLGALNFHFGPEYFVAGAPDALRRFNFYHDGTAFGCGNAHYTIDFMLHKIT